MFLFYLLNNNNHSIFDPHNNVLLIMSDSLMLLFFFLVVRIQLLELFNKYSLIGTIVFIVTEIFSGLYNSQLNLKYLLKTNAKILTKHLLYLPKIFYLNKTFSTDFSNTNVQFHFLRCSFQQNNINKIWFYFFSPQEQSCGAALEVFSLVTFISCTKGNN